MLMKIQNEFNELKLKGANVDGFIYFIMRFIEIERKIVMEIEMEKKKKPSKRLNLVFLLFLWKFLSRLMFSSHTTINSQFNGI